MANNNWHEEYKARYARLKHEGVSFFPFAVVKDTIVAFLILAALVALALTLGAPLEELADPTDSTYNPRPEWYFLFLFQALKLFPGSLEAVAAVVLPGLLVGALFILPLLDRGPERRAFARPFVTGAGVALLAGMAFLTWQGASSPLLNPLADKDPHVLAGRRLFDDLKCVYCHSIQGKGGKVGPDMTKAAEEKEEWLIKHFRNPQATSPGTSMPNLNLLDDEVTALVAFVKSLGGGGAYTAEAPKLFADNCGACHRIGKEGGDAGPDLSAIGTARDVTYLRRYITDPSTVNPASAMPGFAGQLTQVEIEDVARYLAHQGR